MSVILSVIYILMTNKLKNNVIIWKLCRKM